MGQRRSTTAVGVSELPPYRALLVVDLKDFSGFPASRHPELTRMVPDILRQAFVRCGRAGTWNQRLFPRTTGDGYAIGFDPKTLPLLLDPFLCELQEELALRNRVEAAARARPLRMRVSLHVGPMTDSGLDHDDDGSGAARVATHRLLDSTAVRRLLDDSHPETTLVAAIVSNRVFEDVVLGGHSLLDESRFIEVPVQVKTFRSVAYLFVPTPSGGLLRDGYRGGQPSPPGGEAEAGAGEAGASAHDDAAPDSAETGHRGRVVRHGGVGNVTGNSGNIVVGSGPTNIGGGQQIVGDVGNAAFGITNSGDANARDPRPGDDR